MEQLQQVEQVEQLQQVEQVEQLQQLQQVELLYLYQAVNLDSLLLLIKKVNTCVIRKHQQDAATMDTLIWEITV